MQPGFKPSPELYPFASRWFASSAGRVHYVDEGQGRPIIFFHGNPTWSFLYRHIILALRGHFRCIAMDYPGFGLSERPAGYGYTPAEHARATTELVAHLDLRDSIVMGQDWGGPIGMATALAHADRVSGLVFGNTWFWPLRNFTAKLFSRVTSSWPMQWLILEKNFFVRRLIPAGTARRLSPQEMEHYRAVQPDRAARAGVAEFPRQILAAGPWLEGIASQVKDVLGQKRLLLVWGLGDPLFPADKAIPVWQRYFSDVEVVKLPHAKHFIQEDAPKEIAEAILRRFG